MDLTTPDLLRQPEDLADGWEADARKLREYGQESAAKIAELHARQLRDALRGAGEEALTLAEAAAESGYSKRRLREFVSEGSIPNAGRKGAPRIRRGDLPKKAKRQRGGAPSPEAAAVDILNRNPGLILQGGHN